MFGEDPKLLSDFSGKTTHILFWGTWCAAAKAALSKLRGLSENSNDNFLAISGDNEDVELGEWLERNGRGRVKYVFSGNQVADESFIAFNVQDVPVLVVIDPSGEVVYQGDFEKYSGFQRPM
jgi:thiol-disulfide isomerase/thioredoxin